MTDTPPHTARIIDGKAIAALIRAEVKEQAKAFSKKTGIVPSNYLFSMAELIDSNGNILGTMFNDTQHRHLVMWEKIQVPEPGVMAVFAVVAMFIGKRRRAAD